MKPVTHLILRNQLVSGIEHGMLRDLEDEVVLRTAATVAQAPMYPYLPAISTRAAHGTRYATLRRFLPRMDFELVADVLWVIMMGPEEWQLDLCKSWDRKVGYKILYLFDTMEGQLPTIRRVVESTTWDLTITSFRGAVPLLEAQTQRNWFVVPQGVRLDRFKPRPAQKRAIDFCSYGRRLNRIHDSIKRFCADTGLEYQYTTARTLAPGTDPREQYQHYAWHLGHSSFSICWPVETTNPERVLTFSPITCRWFEAAASGTVVLGKAPADSEFTELFGNDFVVPVDLDQSDDQLRDFWREIWSRRLWYLERAHRTYCTHSAKWSWARRVEDILRLAKMADLHPRASSIRSDPCLGATEINY